MLILRALPGAVLLSAVFFLLPAAVLLTAAEPAKAQSSEIVSAGDAAVTGYAATPDDPALQILDLSKTGGKWADGIVDAPATLKVPASEIGQVFGLAFDDATPPNIYTNASSAYGLKVDGTDVSAKWAPGQFGLDDNDNGGPGSIWKIDGVTGEVSLFADIALNGTPNSGPGLGTIAFDPISQQLFVSDRDTGMIHRFDLGGNDLGTFDHGVTARPVTGLKALPFEASNRLDITSGTFKADDPKTWGFAEDGRNVWGLAIDGGRLYYAVAEGPQVWSVSINGRGEFGDDPRFELDLPIDFSPNPISAIAFTADGKMILAQLGAQDNAVMVFTPETPEDIEDLEGQGLDTPNAWVPDPEIIPVGEDAPFRQAAGGVAIGHGYNEDGTLNTAACQASVWITGNDLTMEGTEAIEGLQGQRATGFSATPAAPKQVDFIKLFDGSDNGAGIGGIAIFTDCAAEPVAELPPYEPPTCPGDDPRCPGEVVTPGPGPGPEPIPGPDLEIVKIAQGERCNKGQPCTFNILVRNVGTEPYYGPITFDDEASGSGTLVGYGPTETWTCAASGYGFAECRHEDTYLDPGDGVFVELTFELPPEWPLPTYRNCASLRWAGWQGYGDINPGNDRACDYAPVCQPGTPGCGPDLMVEQFTTGTCEAGNLCRLRTRITNVGAEDYTGPLSFIVDRFSDGLVLQTYTSTAEWSCGAVGAGNYQCFSGPETLTPGEWREVSITLIYPDDTALEELEQCVMLRQLPAGGDQNSANNYACATMRVCSETSPCPADLEARYNPSVCSIVDGTSCQLNFSFRNVGTDPFLPDGGSISYINDFGAGPRFERLSTFNPGTCEAGPGAEGPISCTIPVEPGGLPPGGQVFSRLYYDVEGLEQTSQQACVKLQWDEDGTDPNPDNDEACITLALCTGAGGCPVDLMVTGQSPVSCFRGEDCGILFLVFNLGTNGQFTGDIALTMSSIPEAGSPTYELFSSADQPLGQCDVAGQQGICQTGPVTLGPASQQGRHFYAIFTQPIPADYARDTAEVCMELDNVEEENLTNNRYCLPVSIFDPAQIAAVEKTSGGDVAVTKTLRGACAKAGDTCSFRIRVSNEGTAPIEGDIVIEDALSPASGSFVGASGPGWTAEADGDGKAVLTFVAGPLEPGQPKAVDVTFKMNADAAGEVENCATLRKLPGDGNTNTGTNNDTACVSVTLEEETTEPPPPPPPPEGELDLSVQMSGDNSCASNDTCTAEITLTNEGTEAFDGPLTMIHSIAGAAGRYAGGGSGFGCAAAADSMVCTNTDLALAPGATASYPANFSPNSGTGGTFQNCAEIQWTRAGGTADLVMAQQKLIQLGYDVGTVDGKLGPKTRSALIAYQRTSGLRQSGQLDPATSRRLLGSPERFDDINPGNDRDCLTTTISTTCTGGRFLSGGACICPKGQSFIRGSCRKPPVTCSSDKILVNGRCVCPRGTTLQKGICKKPVVTPCKTQGQYRDRNGKCRCPSVEKVIRGVCRKPVTACTADKILVNGRCVCPSGMTLQRGICQPPVIKGCPYKGQSRGRDGKCRCPSGQKVISGRCKKPPTACIAQACPARGQTRGSDCKCRCPSGQNVIRGVCQRPPTKGLPPEIRDQIPCNSTMRKLGVC